MTIPDDLGKSLWGRPGTKVAEEFYSFSSRCDKKQFETMQQDIAGLERQGHFVRMPPSDLAQHIIASRDARRAASYVRVSDGEGNLLPGSAGFPVGDQLKEFCLGKISYIHFGDPAVITANAGFFGDMLQDAISSADVIGFPSFDTVLAGFDVPDPDKDVRALMGNRLAVTLSWQLAREHAAGRFECSSAWFSRDLLPHYRRILEGQQHVGLVSVYPELATKLEGAFDIGKVHHVQVPVQAVFVPTKERKNTQHYPDAMHRIISELQPVHEGMVYLVAAGLLGKKYCSTIKQRGGIAIDIGSIAEVWMGIQARGMSERFVERWTLAPA